MNDQDSIEGESHGKGKKEIESSTTCDPSFLSTFFITLDYDEKTLYNFLEKESSKGPSQILTYLNNIAKTYSNLAVKAEPNSGANKKHPVRQSILIRIKNNLIVHAEFIKTLLDCKAIIATYSNSFSVLNDLYLQINTLVSKFNEYIDIYDFVMTNKQHESLIKCPELDNLLPNLNVAITTDPIDHLEDATVVENSSLHINANTLPNITPKLYASWRNICYDSEILSELALINIIRSIDKATIDEISSELSDCEIMTLNEEKRPHLEKLNENLIEKVTYISDDCELLKKYTVEAYKASRAWLDKLDDIINYRNLYLTFDRNFNEPLKLEKFSGYNDRSNNIYEFLKQFDVLTNGVNMMEKAYYLYYHFLSNDIRNVVRHCSNDLIEMKRHLVHRFGDVNKLLSIKISKIKALPIIQFESTFQQKIDYVTGFIEVLKQIKLLVDLNADNSAMVAEIFSNSNIRTLSSLLPSFLYQEYVSVYVEKYEYDNSGSFQDSMSFELLLLMLKRTLSSFEFSVEYYPEESDNHDFEKNVINFYNSNINNDSASLYPLNCVNNEATILNAETVEIA